MSLSDEDRRAALHALLPAIHRRRDAERGAPLAALTGVLADEGGRMEDDILQLLDDWFIETCAEWVVPYIGDLLGVRGLQEVAGAGVSRRALVANTLAYRRRKGTAAVLEQLAFDATGWPAVAREMFLALHGTQHMQHPRPQATTVSLRDAAAFDRPQGPFGRAAHGIDVRPVALRGGRFNIPNIALHLWRLQAYRIAGAGLRPAGPSDSYHVAPNGADAPLFNLPRTDAGTVDRAGARSVPAPLRRRALHDELEARRQALAEGRAPAQLWFDAAEPAFVLDLDGTPVAPERVAVCDLSGWRAPPDSRDYTVRAADGSESTVSLPIDAAVDPELGRVRLAPARAGVAVRLTHAAGFSGDLGAGPYGRRAHIEAILAERPVTWAAGVAAEPPSPSDNVFPDLSAALAAWRAQPPGSFGVIAVMDSARYPGELTGADRIELGAGSRLLIVAADWPALPDPAGPPGALVRIPGRVDPDARRPVIAGDVEVAGTAPADSATPGELFLDGLMVDGALTVADGALGRLALSHATLIPPGGLAVAAGNPALEVALHRTIAGAVSLAVPVARLSVSDSILDAAAAIAAPGTPLEIADSTVLGTAEALTIDASGAIFMGAVTAARRQAGCVRYSHVPEGSQTPRRFRCQPDLALREAPAAEATGIRARLRPAFTAPDFGAPGYGQLSDACAAEIREGGEDGDEIGAFRFLRQPRRRANLRNTLPDYLPFGLEYGTFFET